MRITAFIEGIICFIGGAILLPSPPASPEEIGASLAPVAFFFGGAFLISGLFAGKHPQHGNAAIFLLAVMGSLYFGYLSIAKDLETIPHFVIVFLFCGSVILFFKGFNLWKQKRREENLRRLEEMDDESEA